MKTYFEKQDGLFALFAVSLLLIGFATMLAACDPATAGGLTAVRADHARPASPKYFGDEFADAQRALRNKSVEEMPPTF